MPNERISRWKEAKYLPLIITFPNETEESQKEFANYITNYNKKYKKIDSNEDDLQTSIFESAKEVIFDFLDNKPILHFITYAIDASNGQIQISHILDAIYKNESEDDTRESIKFNLALAKFHDVPVYPNTDDLMPMLAKYHQDLLNEGFKIPDRNGNNKRYLLTKSYNSKIENLSDFEKLSFTKMYNSAELQLMRQAIQQEFEGHKEAERILEGLRSAILELENCLDDEKRNEGALQRVLTVNPILFGVDYDRIQPKHSLGSEFEMDYALWRRSGEVDLVEIDASNLKLFKNDGNPTQYLIHAEQQVLDWLRWIERNHPYAREKLPGVMKPSGYIVIGRTKNLSKSDSERLKQRNIIFKGSFEILTYDDLLVKSKCLLRTLEGLQK